MEHFSSKQTVPVHHEETNNNSLAQYRARLYVALSAKEDAGMTRIYSAFVNVAEELNDAEEL